MDLDIFLNAVQASFSWFLQSHIFAVLKLFLQIYTLVLIADIILLLYLRNIGADLKKNLFGTEKIPSISDSVMRKKWKGIEGRLQSGNPSEYKAAVLEADAIVNQILSDVGYAGENMANKLDEMDKMQSEDSVALREAHQISNRIVFEPDFSIDREAAEKSVRIYKDFLKKFDFFI